MDVSRRRIVSRLYGVNGRRLRWSWTALVTRIYVKSLAKVSLNDTELMARQRHKCVT